MADISPSAGERIGIGLSAWLRILDFRGRSTRTDVFRFFVVAMLLGLGAALILSTLGLLDLTGALRGIVPDLALRQQLASAFGFLPFLPMFALLAWRLRNVGLSGWPGPLFLLAGAALSIWNEVHFRFEAIEPMYRSAQLLRATCLFAIYAALLWAPQRRTNRYGPDPRADRDPEPAQSL
jgi:uncharacterized membrane protein YhaH (DUF805 family)